MSAAEFLDGFPGGKPSSTPAQPSYVPGGSDPCTGVIGGMSEVTATREVIIANRQGLHARPAHAFVTLAAQFDSKIEIERDGERVDGKSILSILTLGAVQGTRLVLHISGRDAQAAMESLTQLVEHGFADEDSECLGEKSSEPHDSVGEDRSEGSMPGA